MPRIVVRGKRRDLGLGSCSLVSLAEARERALEYRRIARSGGNPVDKRREEMGGWTTFEELARHVHKRKFRTNTSNGKHIAQWIRTLETYAFPIIGNVAVADVTQQDIEDVLDPIWQEKAETARRVKQRIAYVFDHAIGQGYRRLESPVRGIQMDAQETVPEHFAALDFTDISGFMNKLRKFDTVGARALAFTTLTVARSGSVRHATWDQFDRNFSTWTIPAKNMKGRRIFSIPLSFAARELLFQQRKSVPEEASLVFPSPRNQKRPLSENTMRKFLQDLCPGYTVHGMRAAFRVWCALAIHVRHEVAEEALAHAVYSKTVRSYLRTDYFDERELLMEKWAMWLEGEMKYFSDGIDLDAIVRGRLMQEV